MTDSEKGYRHFFLTNCTMTEKFKRPSREFDKKVVPGRDRYSHGAALQSQLESLKHSMQLAREAQEEAGLIGESGLIVEFESFPDIELAFESLARERSGIELLNVRHGLNRTYATVFVPDGKLKILENIVQEYIDEKRDRNGDLRDHGNLINTIQRIRAGALKALWTDTPQAFPEKDEEKLWWEVWLPVRKDRKATLSTFRELAEAQDFRISSGFLEFPERTVLLAHATKKQMSRSIMTLNSIAELRRAKETADFFDTLMPQEQAEWLDDLLSRAQIAGQEEIVPFICLLDTGVNNGHPLLSGFLAAQDLHTVEPAWGMNDSEGHGTAMAGLALAGNLTDSLESEDPIQIGHRLESVKLLPTDGANDRDPNHHGFLTIEAVSRPEVTSPNHKRAFCMAVTARDDRDRGRPSAWSATLDRLASDADGDGNTPRLFIVSGGNIFDPNAWGDYPMSNRTDGIHDPGQAWNILTVGAYTELTRITEPDTDAFSPIAEQGGLSPFSTTSCTWQPHWPLKPDIVCEGGNAAKDTLSAIWMPSLSLLTSYYRPNQRLFTTANATSAATALAGRMAAQIMAVYPELWPETLRALMVHSAEWTDAMRAMFLPQKGLPLKKDMEDLVRHCGFGVPDINRALWSMSNSLTMVIEERLTPFKREQNKQPTLGDMHLHELPWPISELESLGETEVEMRVTLSYFIEPNPSSRGVRSRYRYESHGLRFDVKRPLESIDVFRARINAKARDEEEGDRIKNDDPKWLLGISRRHRGSLHSDIWKGSAVDLASRGVLAVFPTVGWWKTRTRLERYEKTARYTLVVSIRAPEVDVDLYNSIANQISVPVEIGY